MKFLVGAGNPKHAPVFGTEYMQLDGNLSEVTVEARVQLRVRAALTLSRLGVHVTVGPINASTVRSRVNGGNGNLVITVPSGTTGDFEDTTNSDSLVSGDLVNVSATCASNDLVVTLIRALLDDGGANSTVVAAGRGFSSSASTYTHIFGFSQNNTTEGPAQWRSPGEATLSKLRLYAYGNTRNGTCTWKLRKNGGDGNQVVTIPSATTGEFEDTTNSDSLVSGDLVNYQQVMAGSSGTVTISIIHMTLGASERVVGCSTAVTNTSPGVYYANVMGRFFLPTSETDLPLDIPEAFAAKEAVANVQSNTLNGDMNIILRKNAADTGLTISIPAGTSGIFQATGSANIGAGDDINWKVDASAATTGSFTLKSLSLQNTPAAAGRVWGNTRQIVQQLLMH